MTQNYNTLVNALNQFSTHHLSLKRFKCSFFEQLDNFSTSANTFPILYAVPQDVTFEQNIDEYSFRIYCLDVLQKDRSNEGAILNETLLILRDLTNWLRLNATNDLNILNVPRTTPINNFGMDGTCGWYMDVEIEASTILSECSIPFNSSWALTGLTCDSTYVNAFLTCDTLSACTGIISITNRLGILEGLTGNTANLVPYTGATSNVNLNSKTITANSFIKSGGTSTQFLKANGAVDSNTYLTTASAASLYLPLTLGGNKTVTGLANTLAFNVNKLNINSSGAFTAVDNNTIDSATLAVDTNSQAIYLLYTNAAGQSSYVSSDSTAIQLLSINASSNAASYKSYWNPQSIANNGNNNQIIIEDNISGKGIIYAADYSANFTPESLVTKRYVDNTFLTPSSANTLYISSSASTLYIPYSGASSNININSRTFTSVGNTTLSSTTATSITINTGILSIQRSQNANVTNLNINAGSLNTSVFQVNTDQPNNSVYVTSRNNYGLGIQTNDTNRIFISSGGTIGIGTTVPNATLDISGTSGNIIQIKNSGGNTGLLMDTALKAYFYGGGGLAYPVVSSSVDINCGIGFALNTISLNTNSLSRAKLVNSDFGIGLGSVTNPSARLHVSGTTKINTDSLTAFTIVNSTASTNTLTVDSIAGTVGIGTNTITNGFQLQVVGTAYASVTMQAGVLTTSPLGEFTTIDPPGPTAMVLQTRGGNANDIIVRTSGSAQGETARFTSGGSLNVGATTTTNQRRLKVAQDTAFLDIGSQLGATSQVALYANRATPNTTNHFLASDGNNVYLNTQDASTIYLQSGGATIGYYNYNQIFWGGKAATTGAVNNFIFTKPNNTNQTASNEISGFKYNSGSRHWATGNFPLQRENYWSSIYYDAVSGSVITDAFANYYESISASTAVTINNNWVAGFEGNVKIKSVGTNRYFEIEGTAGQKARMASDGAGAMFGSTTAVPTRLVVQNGVFTPVTLSVLGNTNIESKMFIGDTTSVPSAQLHIKSGSTAQAQIRLNAGATPASPNDGDIWFDSASNTLKMRISGVTKTFTMT